MVLVFLSFQYFLKLQELMNPVLPNPVLMSGSSLTCLVL